MSNRLTPQANALFTARLNELVQRVQNELTNILADHAGRGMLNTSGTVVAVYDRVNAAIAEMGQIAVKTAQEAYEASDYKLHVSLERQTL